MDIWMIIAIVMITINVSVLIGIIIVFCTIYKDFKMIAKCLITIDCNISNINSKCGYIERMVESLMRIMVAVETKVKSNVVM